MPKKALGSLGSLVKSRRGARKLRETALELGIGAATLMRIENGHIPDVQTFGKVCKWLNVDPGEFLGFEKRKSAAVEGSLEFSVHLRADRAAKPQTLNALGNMIALASRIQPESKNLDG